MYTPETNIEENMSMYVYVYSGKLSRWDEINLTQGIVLLSQVTKEQRMDLLRVYFKVGREYWFTPGILHRRKGVNQTMLIGGVLVYTGYTVNQTM